VSTTTNQCINYKIMSLAIRRYSKLLVQPARRGRWNLLLVPTCLAPVSYVLPVAVAGALEAGPAVQTVSRRIACRSCWHKWSHHKCVSV